MFNYDPAVDSAYIQLSPERGVDSEEIAEGIIVDYDSNNNVIAIELLNIKTIPSSSYMALNQLFNKNEGQSND